MQVKDLIVTGDARIVGNLYTNTGALAGGSGSGGGSSSGLTYTLSKSGSTISLKGSDGSTSSVTDSNSDTNTTYSLATGDSNGQIKITPSSGSAYNVSVKGLGSAAYTSSSNYLSISGGTLTGPLYMESDSGNSINMLQTDIEPNTHAICFGSRQNNCITDIYGGGVGYNGGIRLIIPGQTTATAGDINGVALWTSNSSVPSYFRPINSGDCGLGSENHRWYRLWAANSTNTSSDEREKSDIMSMADYPVTYSRDGNGNVFEKLFNKLQPKTYTLNIEDTNEIHMGFIAQDVANAMEELGLSEDDLGVISHDYWIDEKTGEEKDRYGLAYEEFTSLNTHMIQKQQKEINDLKQQIEELKALLEK